MSAVYRTPDDRFTGLPDFPFEPHYRELASGLRVHYVDEGPRDGRPVLMMHGEPSWCFLYRKMIPPVAAAGFRVLAPDLIGFGKSDKPTSKGDYTYARHVAWMQEWFEALDLRDVILACQDWGSLVGLRLVAAMPDRFEHLAFERFWLQPMDGPDQAANTAAAIDYCLTHPKWRLSVQTHKYIGVR